eukprot:3242669-Amphidinium_carterae.2
MPLPVGGGANVATRMQRLINPTTQMPYSSEDGGNDYVLDHNVWNAVGVKALKAARPVLNASDAPGEHIWE